jgi:hypothetical protein
MKGNGDLRAWRDVLDELVELLAGKQADLEDLTQEVEELEAQVEAEADRD